MTPIKTPMPDSERTAGSLHRACSAAWQRGYFCAVAALIRQNGTVTTNAIELFKAGGDATKADECDQELFREMGLLLNNQAQRPRPRGPVSAPKIND